MRCSPHLGESIISKVESLKNKKCEKQRTAQNKGQNPPGHPEKKERKKEIPRLFACFYESVSCVYVFFSTCLSTCVASVVWFVLGFVIITTFLSSFFFFFEFNIYRCHGALDVRTTLLLCLSPSCICVLIILIPAYVYLNIHMLFPPLPYLYTFIAIFISMFCDMFYSCTHLFVLFLLVPKLIRHLCYGAY